MPLPARRPIVILAAALVGIGALTGGLAWLLDTPKAPAGASRAERLYAGVCASCHGADGRGSWRAALFLVNPGNLADPAQASSMSDTYVFDLIKHGGSPIGRPGMPAFGATLNDPDIALLVAYVKTLPARAR